MTIIVPAWQLVQRNNSYNVNVPPNVLFVLFHCLHNANVPTMWISPLKVLLVPTMSVPPQCEYPPKKFYWSPQCWCPHNINIPLKTFYWSPQCQCPRNVNIPLKSSTGPHNVSVPPNVLSTTNKVPISHITHRSHIKNLILHVSIFTQKSESNYFWCYVIYCTLQHGSQNHL